MIVSVLVLNTCPRKTKLDQCKVKTYIAVVAYGNIPTNTHLKTPRIKLT